MGRPAGELLSCAPIGPNNSFKPTPCRGVSRVPALRLHASAAPPRVGLTQALGGRKAFCKCAAHRLDSPTSVGCARRTDCRLVATSFKSAGRAHSSHVRRAYRLRKQRSATVRFSAPYPLLRRRPAESSRGALRPSHFGFRQVGRSVNSVSIPPA